MRYYLEYAQYRNGEFSAWIEGGDFATREEAARCAHAHGLAGDDYKISEYEVGSDFFDRYA